MNNAMRNIVHIIGRDGGSILGPTPSNIEKEWIEQFGITCEESELNENETLYKKLASAEVKNFFKPEEFACKCCGKGGVVSRVHKALNFARAWAGVPFVITSGYRCPKHNAEVGGVPESSHTKRLAVDIRVPSSADRFLIIQGLIEAGFTRYGIGADFIHADMDETKVQEVAWTYYGE